MEEKSTLYSFAIIAQPIHQEKSKKYMWQRQGKYKRLEDAEKAIERFTNNKVTTIIYRIVPFFEGYWWIDEETRKASYFETNRLLWEFLSLNKLRDEALKYVQENKDVKKGTFF